MPLAAATRIARLVELTDHDLVCWQVEAIFFETSGRQSFDSEAARSSYRERWLGRYLTHFSDECFVALTDDGAVVGYLAGCLEDPARSPRFSDVSYFATFSHLTSSFPAHLHINLTAGRRGEGIGAKLIEAFAGHAAHAGVPGMHVVTGEGARNNRFYLACGFRQLGATDWMGNRIAFFGRPLTSAEGDTA